MSRIRELGDALENVGSLVLEYEKELDDVEDKLRVEGKTVEFASREQASHLYYYMGRKAELNSILLYMEKKVDAIRGKKFRKYTENWNQAISDRAKEQYVNNETEVLSMYELYLEVKEIHEKYAGVVKAFEARGFALRNKVELLVAEKNEVIW